MRTNRRGRLLAGVALSAVLAVGVAGCGAGGGDGAGGGADGRVRVVASTNVWASVVSAVGGDYVDVIAVIDDQAGDPHSYQAGARDAATVRSADLLVANGGGYDAFFTQLAEGAETPMILAVPGGGDHDHGHDHGDGHDHGRHSHGEHADGHDHSHAHGDGNEHVWYDLAVVSEVAERVSGQLGDLQPEHREDFEAGAEAFTSRVDELHHRVEKIADEHAGARVASTEPIADHLIADAGLDDVTPKAFSAAVENETDVPVAAQQQMLARVSGEVDLLVQNTQTATPATENVVAKAREAGVPVVDVTETLPEGRNDYISWMNGQVDALAKALDE